MALPQELLDAARLDGALDLSILHRVVLPALLTQTVVYPRFVWTDLPIAVIFVQDDAKRTLMPGISDVKLATTTRSRRRWPSC